MSIDGMSIDGISIDGISMEADLAEAPRLRAEDLRALLDRQTDVLHRIARTAPLPEILGSILTALEELIPGARCSVLLLDPTDRTLRHGAAPSLPAAYVAAIDGLPIGDGAGACGTAAARNEPVVSIDVRRDPRWRDFRAVALAAGLGSCWSTPIEGRDGQPVGTFAVYHGGPHQPGLREQLLVGRFRELASVAIEHGRLLTEREAAERDRRARLAAETARRTAEELLAAKSELLAAVGHDARTPMQAIIGFAEVLQTLDLDDGHRREALQHIGFAAQHVMDLLRDVLDLSRIEANALVLRTEAVDVAAVVDDVCALLAPDAARRGMTLTHEMGVATARADDRRLRQILLNLVGNAIRHGTVGGRVQVSCRTDHGVTVAVADDGPGIPVPLRGRLFTPYAAGPDQESAGLGLALAHSLAAAMGGELRLGRTGPKGTIMVVHLPTVATDPTTRRTQPETIDR